MVKTIQVDEATYAALRSYKVGGMTFADVIRRLMEHEDPEQFHQEYRAWQDKVLANIRKSGEYESL